MTQRASNLHLLAESSNIGSTNGMVIETSPACISTGSLSSIVPSNKLDCDKDNIENSDDQSRMRKKVKSRRGLEKSFICDVPGCLKSFTRMEHLGRHQLNHSPKQIFTCTWPECTKSFVREDLRARHIDRHRKRNSSVAEPLDVAKTSPSVESRQASLFFKDNSTNDGPSGYSKGVTSIIDDFGKNIDVNMARNVTFVASNGFLEEPIVSEPTVSPISQTSISNTELNARTVDFTSPNTNGNYFNEAITMHPDRQDHAPPFHNTEPDISPSSADLIDWLFSDGMLSGNRDFFVPPDINSFLESPLLDIAHLSTPPQFSQSGIMSENKRLELISIVPTLESRDDFSLPRIHRYIETYWERFHFQFPILHRRSFEEDLAPTPLILSVILIGASYERAFDLTNLIAEPLRWIIFSSPGFNPPTKVWILQSLLLLEVYEKMMSTRGFHERAHIHHGATLQLIRRGTTLLDPSVALSNDDADGSSWRRWVEAESIKRAVFMAFILDVTHSLIFGHSLLMYPFEIRLSLPCSDKIWESGDDERQLLTATPSQPFLFGLKRMLNQQPINVDSFGRRVLFGGLVSLSIQMSQQALQVSSIGWGSFRNTWKSTVGRAYDFWKDDFERVDLLLAKEDPSSLPSNGNQPLFWLMYHMAHVCINSARYDLHVFCGDNKVLGRSTSIHDYLASKRHVYEWARTKGASDAAFHAIKALYRVFMTGDEQASSYPAGYSIADDAFVHRSAMIFHFTLVFWAYAFCRGGPESRILAGKSQFSRPSIRKDHEWAIAAESGRMFLERMNKANTPDELESLEQKHLTVGLLKWVILSLSASKWELMMEMCGLLDNCVQLSLGKEDESDVTGDAI